MWVGESTPSHFAMHSPLVVAVGDSGAAVPAVVVACRVGADWVGSVGCLVNTTVGGIAFTVVVSATVVAWLIPVVSVSANSIASNVAVSITIVAGGVVTGAEAGVR